MKADLKTVAAGIKVLLLDVDGVFTDGSIYFGPEGEALKKFNARDGAAIKWLQRAGLTVAIISGRQSAPVAARARELGIAHVIQDARKKLPAFQDFLKTQGLGPEEVAFMGDDLIDLPVLRRVGLSLAPADAVPEVRAE